MNWRGGLFQEIDNKQADKNYAVFDCGNTHTVSVFSAPLLRAGFRTKYRITFGQVLIYL
jgi:hypothetical protein